MSTMGVLLMATGLALLGFYGVRAVVERMSVHTALENYYAASTAAQAAPAEVGSRAYKVRLALGEWAAGREQQAVAALAGAAGLLLAVLMLLFGLPWPVAVLAGFGLGYTGVNSWIEGRWHKVVRSMEAEMPTFLRTLGSMVVVTPNVLDALDETTAALDEKGALRLWMTRFVEALRLHGRKGFETMQAEAGRISPTLLLAVVEIGRLWETGGAQFAHAFRQAAENQARMLRARNHAQAEIDGARSTLRVILLTLGGAVAFTVHTQPQQFDTLLGHAALLSLAVLAGVGWMLLQSMMDEVLR